MVNPKKMILGTVQLGVPYGISNENNQVTEGQAHMILDLAYRNGIRVLDTASSYGKSESIIGMSAKIHNWKIITKIPHIRKNNIKSSDIKYVSSNLMKSLDNLMQDSIEGVMIHSCNDLFKPGGALLLTELERLQNLGMVKKIGVSVYTGEQINSLLKIFKIDFIQLPINILDQRLLAGGYLKDLKKHNIEIHARSVFLQGLLLMDLHCIPSYFSPIFGALKNIDDMAKKLSISKLELAISFIQSVKNIDQMVVGVHTADQLYEILNTNIVDVDYKQFDDLAISDINYLNPSNWKT